MNEKLVEATIKALQGKLLENENILLYGLFYNNEPVDLHWMKNMGFYPSKEEAQNKLSKYLKESGYYIDSISENYFLEHSLDAKKYLSWKNSGNNLNTDNFVTNLCNELNITDEDLYNRLEDLNLDIEDYIKLVKAYRKHNYDINDIFEDYEFNELKVN